MRKRSRILWRGKAIAQARSFVRRATIPLGLAAALGTLALTAPSPRRPSMSQRLPVSIRWLSEDGVLIFTASTPNKGTSFADRWSISPSLALTSATATEIAVGDETARVSTAHILESALVPDTTYTFNYSIVVRVGEDRWSGSGSVAITVGTDDTKPPPAGFR